ncbi:competence type IV pilus minor pilin ComGD, partial [Enterococcus faecalis]
MNKSAGFILMEILASLTIVCFMTILTTLAIHRWQETLKIEQFL